MGVRPTKFLCTAALLALVAAPASAISVLEGGTDFSDTLAGSTSIGQLDAGNNTISGALDGACAINNFVTAITCFSLASGQDNVDAFRFTVASGFELVDASISMRGDAPEGFQYQASLYTTSFETITFGLYDMGDGGSFSQGELLSAGEYIFSVRGFSASQEADFSGEWTATGLVRAIETDDDTAVIPLPAGAPLILGALGLLGLIRRRR